jgi:hypothetical protein
MDCREGAAELASSGGSVAIDSLDGSLAISSAGGDVQASTALWSLRLMSYLAGFSAVPNRQA